MNFHGTSENSFQHPDEYYKFLFAGLVPVIDTSVDSNSYKFQSSCHLCSLKLRKSKSTARDKLHHCKFCWQATCDSCSKLKLFHSQLLKECRICKGCLKISIKNKVLAEVKEKAKDIRRSSILALRKDKERIKLDQLVLHQLIEEADAKNAKLEKVKKELSAVYREVNQNSRDLQDLEGKTQLLYLKNQLEVEIKESNQLSEETLNNKKEIIKMKKYCYQLETETEEMEIFLSNSRAKRFTLKIPEFKDVLLDQIACLKGLVNTYKQNQRFYETEIQEKKTCKIM